MKRSLRFGASFHRYESRDGRRRTMTDIQRAIEAAARALCRFDGHPENTKFEGKPMWMSYCSAATAAVEAALPHLQNR
jgi:hypothetical protein